MEKGKVFVSSILNPKIEDLREERQAARDVIESYGFLVPWAFEIEPASSEPLEESYLRPVDECDLFLLIVGEQSTPPVIAECDRAKEKNKRILVLAKDAPCRTPTAKALLALPGVKYASYRTIEELRSALRDAINQELALAIRGQRQRREERSITSQLRDLIDRGRRTIRIRPACPAKAEEDMYFIEELAPPNLIVKRQRSDDQVHIPVNRIENVFVLGESNVPVLILDGRLQRVSPSMTWRFFDERPEAGSVLGFHKASYPHDPTALSVIERLRKKGFECGWASEVEVPGREGVDAQTVYDEDGRYFRNPDPVRSLVLVMKLNPQ